MTKTYERCRWVVEKTSKEFILKKEVAFKGEEKTHIQEILRNNNDVVVIPGSKKYSNWEDFSRAFLMKDDKGLWELYMPIYTTNLRCMDLEKFHKIASNIECYEIQDSYILYKVVPENGSAYWKCISLEKGYTVTEIWNSEEYIECIPKRIKNIPKILAKEVCFDLKFRDLYPKKYFESVCVLIADGETILVTNLNTDLGNDTLDSTHLTLPGTIQDFYDRFITLKIESGYILHAIFPVYEKKEDKQYANIVKIEQVLKKDVSDCEIPTGGLAMLDEKGKIVEVMCELKDFNDKRRYVFPEARISKKFDIPVEEISFRKIKTSDPDMFVLEMNYWNNNEKKSFYKYEGVTFEI